MAHYAFIDSDNVVTNVIVGREEYDVNGLPDGFDSWESYYANLHGQTCLRTSYNTLGNEHKSGGTPFRGNYAGIGYTYDADSDVFIAPQPYPSWSLNLETFLWEAPSPYPDDGNDYQWNEDSLNWEQIVPPPSD